MTHTAPYGSSPYAIDGKDILIEGAQDSIAFAMRVNGTTTVNETYNFNPDGTIRICGIGRMVSQCLYGQLKAGSQPNAKATVDFLIDDAVVNSYTLYSSRMKNPRDPNGTRLVMAASVQNVCRAGMPFYLTFRGSVAAALRRSDGSEIASVSVGSPGEVYTQDCDPQRLFPSQWADGSYIGFGGEMAVSLTRACQNDVAVRFLNRYDVPETVIAAYMTDKPSAQDDVAVMNGLKTRFSVESSTEYTLYSLPVVSDLYLEAWDDLVTARKAQILMHGQWIDIVVTKSNYTRDRRRFYGSQVQVSFQTADNLMVL